MAYLSPATRVRCAASNDAPALRSPMCRNPVGIARAASFAFYAFHPGKGGNSVTGAHFVGDRCAPSMATTPSGPNLGTA